MSSPLAGKDVLVTGGAGFIGSHLTEALVRAGARSVSVVDDLSTGSLENLSEVRDTIEFVQGDICDPTIAAHAAEQDVVFHLAVRNVRASIANPGENLRVNANGTLELLEAMRHGSRGRFIYVSSSEVYGIPPDGRYSESSLPGPTTVYGAGKLAGELIALAYHRTFGMDTMVIRPFNNFGPRSHFEGDSGEVIPKFILRALVGRPLLIHGDGTQSRDFMFVAETADWLVRLSTVDAMIGGVLNIGTGEDIAVIDLARMIIDITGSASEISHGIPRPGDVPRLCADIEKARELVDFELSTPFAEGLQRTIEYFRATDAERLLDQEVEQNWL